MPNQLVHETSPYLLQHANNPVNWYPWGDAAWQRARDEQQPVFLSIGYSACHWCHVMEHESFENEQIAAALNQHFVCIKVDREERPDLDQIYMNAVQLLTGRGGWPMSVFLTPDRHPFFGGTYWPPEPRMGMPGFDQILAAVAEAWKSRRDLVVAQAGELTQHLQKIGEAAGNRGELAPELLGQAVVQLERGFDFAHGGFGSAPKFPHCMDLQLLLRVWHRTRRDNLLEMVKLNLDRMARGGIYDHLAGGFARYSVDESWLVPHFEKMLYDNALLADTYLDAYQVTGELRFATVARETLDYVLTYMTDERGGFYSAEDADSEGVEGKFYVWTLAEIQAVLGPERAERFSYVYDVTAQGNFEGHNILNLPKTIEQCAALRGWKLEELQTELADSRRKLLAARDRRVRPRRDDKVLAAWNALAIQAMARAGNVLGEPRYTAAAARCAGFLDQELRRPDGRLLHTWRGGVAKLDAYLDDYAYLANALVSLYEATFEERWIDAAAALAETMLQHFPAAEGGFYYTAADHESLIARQRDLHDSSVPSGNGMAATVLARLGKLLGEHRYLTAARTTAEQIVSVMRQSPSAAGQMLIATDFVLGPVREIVVLARDRNALQEALTGLRERYLPNRVLAARVSGANPGPPSARLDPLFAGKTLTAGQSATVFVCENFVCAEPISGLDAINQLWERLAG